VSEVAEMLDIWPIETCNLQQKRGLVTAIQTIQNFKFEVLPHPPCSPDLALCHFYALGPLKEALCGCWFGSGEVKLALHTWIWKQPKTCFSDEIRQLMDCKKKREREREKKRKRKKKSVWNCRETVLKNNRGVIYIRLSLWLVRRYCLYLLIYL